MAVLQRVITYLREKKISQIDLVKGSDISSGTINKIFLGETKNPGIKFFEAVATVCPRFNWNYAFTGEGPEEVGEGTGIPPELRDKIERYMSDRMELLEKIVGQGERVDQLQKELYSKEQLLRVKDAELYRRELEIERLRERLSRK